MTTKQYPSKGWWFFAIFLLLIFILLQLPAAWVLARVFPNQQYIDQVSGNIWVGQADWHWQQLNGVVVWRLKPWEFLLLRVGADVDLTMQNSQMHAQVAWRPSAWQVKQLNGEVSPQTLRQVLPWQWPDSPIHLVDVSLGQQKTTGWEMAEGLMKWGGGALGYPFEGRVERAALPPLLAKLSLDQQRLHIALTDAAQGRMGDIYLSNDQMLDAQLTQRLLLNVSGYKGQAGLDTAVITTRQPLASLGSF